MTGGAHKKETDSSSFLSAAQPTDQGEVSIVVLLVVVGGTIIDLTKYSFLGCEKAKTLSQKVREKVKLLKIIS